MVTTLEGTAHYARLLLAPVEGLDRGFFVPSGKTMFVIILGYFK